jgi:peptide/nickel transport system substrate-binding protein
MRLDIADGRVPSYNNFMLPAAVQRLALMAVLIVSSPLPGFAQGGTLRVGLPSLPAELDPATALEGSVPLIARQVFDTLVQYTDGGDVEPALAAQWSVSKDGLVWSFRLRSGVTFHDGTPLLAQHVVDSLQREIFPGHAQAPAGDGLVAKLLRGLPGVVREVRAKDPRTVEVVLAQPYAPLLTVLAHPAFSVVLSATREGAANRWQGTGPFSITEIGPGRIVLDAAPGHWGRRPRLARIVFIESIDEAQAEVALSAQSLDVLFPAGAPQQLNGALSIPSWRIGYLALQTEKEPFKRVKARRALATALDPAQIASVLGRAAAPLGAFLPRGVWGRRDGPPLMGADPERAKRLLAEARVAPGAPVPLLVGDGGGHIDQPKLAEAIRASLGAAGFAVTVQAESREAALSQMQAGEHQIALAEARVEAGDPHFLLYPLSSSEGATKGVSAVNFSFYRNPRLDDVLVRASQLSFRPERGRLYSRAQALLAEELPWIPIYVRLHWAVARPEVKDLRLHPCGCPRLDRVWLDSQPLQPAPGIPGTGN